MTEIETMESLREQGWLVTLKCIPAEHSYIAGGNVSEYGGPEEPQFVGQGKWCAEAMWMDFKTFRHDEYAMGDTASEALGLLVEMAAASTKEYEAKEARRG